MSKHLKTCILLSLFIAIFTLAFADTYQVGTGTDSQFIVAQIGDGNASQPFIPNFGSYNDSYSRCLYSAAELQAVGISGAGMINSVSYHATLSGGSYSLSNQIVYIRNTTATSFSNSNIISPNGFELVYTGSINYVVSGWHTVEFDTPFLYDGESSIEIIWENRNGSYVSDLPSFMSTYIENMAIFSYSDYGFPTYGYTGNFSDERPDLLVSFTQFSNEPDMVVSTESIDFGNLTFDEVSDARNVEISNLGGGTLELTEVNFSFTGTNANLFSVNPSSLPISLSAAETANVGIIATATEEGDISATLEISYEGATHSVELTAYVYPEGTAIVELGVGTSNQRQPFGAYYGYERSAAIYEADEIGRYGIISSISWYVSIQSATSVPYKIYMGVTQESSQYDMPSYFSEYISDMTLVAQGSRSFSTTGWHEFELAVPYSFVGGNLVVVVETNYGGSGASTYPRFYCTTGMGSTHKSWYSVNSAPTIANDLNGNRPNIMMTLSPLPSEPVLVVQLESHDFGTVPYGMDSDLVQISIMNAGGAPMTIDESNLSFSGADAAMFVYDADLLPLTIASGERGNLTVHVNSTTAGAISATFTITVGSQSADVQLSADILPEGVFEAIVGTGISTSQATGTSGASPYMGNYRSYRIHNLVRGSEIAAAGGIPGFIDAISYNVANLNTYTAMPDYRIRIKHTNLNTLSSRFETTDFVEVFSSNDFMPSVGWNSHYFHTPFRWDGQSNIIIEIVTGLQPSAKRNATVYYNSPGYTCSIIATNNNQSAENTATGNTASTRANMKFIMSLSTEPDMAAMAIVGPRFPNMDSSSNYRVTVRNLSPNAVEDYTVKVMKSDGTELASAPGTLIEPLEMLDITVPWIPTEMGTMQIYGKVVLVGDTFADNDDSSTLSVEVIPAGDALLQFGFNSGTNSETSGPTPYGTFFRAFREQYLLSTDELFALGGAPGLINSISFNVSSVGSCQPMPNYRIRLKHTSANALTTTFETGEYTIVFQENNFLPVAGWNEHAFIQPFFWNGTDNLIVDVVTDRYTGSAYSRNASVLSTPTPFNSVLRYQSDNYNGTHGTSGTLGDFRPNSRLKMMIMDMGSLSGVVMEGAFPLAGATVSVQGTIFSVTTNADGEYEIPYVPIGDQIIVASRSGYDTVIEDITIDLNQNHVLDFNLVGTPDFGAEPTEISFGGKETGTQSTHDLIISNVGGGEIIISEIEIIGDDVFTITDLPTLPQSLRVDEFFTITVNFAPLTSGAFDANILINSDLSDDAHVIPVSGNGAEVITIGSGNATSRMPLDFYWRTSIFQTVYYPAELNNLYGTIDGMRLYNNFSSSNITNTPVKIWIGTTDENDLLSGWISSNEMTLVFDGNLAFPYGQNTINIPFDAPFEYTNGKNVVVLIHRPLDTDYYSSNDLFYVQSGSENRTRKVQKDSGSYDPATITEGSADTTFPKTSFVVSSMPRPMREITGTFSTVSWDLEDIVITATDVDEADITYDAATGAYSIAVPQGYNGTVIPTKAGYVIDPEYRTYASIAGDVADQDYVVKKDLNPTVVITYPEDEQEIVFYVPTPVTITWEADDIEPELYEIKFGAGDWEVVGLETEFITDPLGAGDYTFAVRGIHNTPQAKGVSQISMISSNATIKSTRGIGEYAQISFSVVIPDFVADPDIPADLGDDTSVTIVGTGFIGAVEIASDPADLTSIPNPSFITVNHQVWKLLGTGTATLTFQNNSAEDMWFAYVSGGVWIPHELAAGASEDITIDLGAKDADLEFALGKGGNPTLPVELSYFNAVFMVSENLVKLSWKTESETQMLGYQIYRNTDANLATASLITAKLVDATNSSTGDSYSFLDGEIENGTYYYWLEAVSYSSSDYYGYQTVIVDIPSAPQLPEISSMSIAYPNPFKDATTIDIAIKGGETGTLTIYNMLGQAVYTRTMGEGNFTVKWNGKDRSGNRCGSGVYFYKLTTPTKSETKKMIIMK